MGEACRALGEMRNAMKFLLESLMERNHLEDLGVDGKN
jgi:hypothetical protein